VKVAGLRKDAGDARAFSFIQMLEMLPQMKFPPNFILVENVVGFEVSVD
jgi:tRNA (cytosine38-C5)-methyltransferase